MHATSRNLQRGQTLIETVVAVFILVLGISTALGLGVYAFNNADDSTKVIVGTSLAREGIEAVKNQRDSNWVASAPNSSSDVGTCTFNGGTTQQPCSEYWLNNLNSGIYALDFDGGNNGTSGQIFTQNPTTFALKYCPSTNAYISGTPGAPSCQGAQPSIYSRKIVLQSGTSDGNGNNYYATDVNTNTTYPAYLSAVVTVWWTSRHCPAASDPTQLPSSCKTTLEVHLTNWRKVFDY